ncbi:hypothetical protein BS47DRAFT_1401028 [Hydnum rufescens UP504]|uniref:L-lysine 6-oxidase n=1 Tax=Hydnum rufescens UP504 TaxID=1448309 RepID=A0A9P6AFH7_9AGAM|nr:hypothetical protein BS47DRAFT_1401028 [Hydnum rufescens UP504]
MAPKAVYDPSKGASYNPVPADEIDALEIFPPVGIARLGDSEKEYFFAPEVPGNISPPTPDGNFRDDEQKIRRQAARFRVYAYDKKGLLLGEVNSKNEYTLTWTVHVANKKGSFIKLTGRFEQPTEDRRNPDVDPNLELGQRSKLIVDPGEKTIVLGQGPQNVDLIGDFYGSKSSPTKVYLGELQVDEAGRLVYLGGQGYSQCVADTGKPQPELVSDFDSTDWVDDTSDGWVSVKVTKANSFSKSSAHKASILSAPAKFAWGVYMPTTLYDIMEDVYDRENRLKREQKDVDVEYYTHIYPVLLSAYTLSWTHNQAFEGHGPFSKGNFLSQDLNNDLPSTSSNSLKDAVFHRLREPDYRNKDQAISVFMPRLSGDNGDMVEAGEIPEGPDPIYRFAALTKLQYDRFKRWKDGEFIVDPPPKDLAKIEEVHLSKQPDSLTRAHLESTIGDPLFPGIEMWWLAKLTDTVGLRYASSQINHDSGILPGDLTRGLSLPWQADFDLCNTHWWPAVRPDIVVTKADYEEAVNATSGTDEQKFAIATTTRKNWTRGLRETPSGESFTDMVRFWSYLGFVKRYLGPDPDHPKPPEPPVYLESERRQLPKP